MIKTTARNEVGIAPPTRPKENTMRARNRKTDLEQVKQIAKVMVYLPIKETELSPVVVKHPYTDTGITMIEATAPGPDQDTSKGPSRIINLLEDQEGQEIWMKALEKEIDSMTDPITIIGRITKSYRGAFLKTVREDLSVEDLSKALRMVWMSVENPGRNPSFTKQSWVSTFRRCEPAFLMEPSELQALNQLPDLIEIYRGIWWEGKGNPVDGAIKGLSWTTDKAIAEFFAYRFQGKNPARQGRVYRAYIPKSGVLAYFDGRNEKEVVVDPKQLQDIREI